MFQEFWSEYGGGIVSLIVTSIIGFIGVSLKNIIQKLANDVTKRNIVKSCVLAVEQLHKDIHGEEKYLMCVQYCVEMLNERNIPVSELEIRMLIEAQVKRLNDVIWKDENDGRTDNV